MMELLFIETGDAARSQGTNGGKKWNSQQESHLSNKFAFQRVEVRKLFFPAVYIENQAQMAFQKHKKAARLAIPYKPFPCFQSNVSDRLRQPIALGFVKAGKDPGLPQLLWGKHGDNPVPLSMSFKLI